MMYVKKIVLILCGLSIGLSSLAQEKKTSTETAEQKNERIGWWQEGKFGLFLHWGLYAVTAGEWQGHKSKGNEHFMFYERIPVEQYRKIGKGFTAQKYNADQWVSFAKDAGMKYVVITAKHHDGFAMFNSPSNPFNIVKNTAYGKDPMQDLAAACKKYGLKLCFYYSLGRDWENPDAYWNRPGSKAGNSWDYPDSSKKDNARYIENKVKPQLKELLTQYGPVGIIWFDTPEGTTKAQSEDLRRFILTLQPNCIINSRVGNGFGDYQVSEQKITIGKNPQPWEACITMSGKWGYMKEDKAWKSPELLVRQLIEIVCKGGNLLLNVGPKADGSFPPEAIERLKDIGGWMKINHEAIYGVKPWTTLNENAIEIEDVRAKSAMGKSDNDFTSKNINPDVYFSQKEGAVYIYARSWLSNELVIKSMSKGKINIKSISLLGSSQKTKWQQNNDGLVITMPRQLPQTVGVYVFKVN